MMTKAQEEEYHRLKRAQTREVAKLVRSPKKVRHDWLVNLLVRFNSFVNDVVTKSREREIDKAIEQVYKDQNVR